MPQISAAAALQIALLFSAVPAQYFISRWSGSTAAQRYHATTRLLRIWKEWRTSFLNQSSAWIDWTNQQFSKVKTLVGLEPKEPAAQTPVGAMIFDNDKGFFGAAPLLLHVWWEGPSSSLREQDVLLTAPVERRASKSVRSPRPPFVFLRVGEVVMERKGHMIGVVVSWDAELRAPPEWINGMHSNSEDTKAERTPHYKVLFRGPTPSSLMVAYLPQTQLERVTDTRPDIPTLDNYFTHFDGTRFVMQPWLRELFPEDEDA